MADMTLSSREFLYEHLVGPAAVGGIAKLATSVPPPSEGLSWTWWWLVPAALAIGPGAAWVALTLYRRRR
jgi:hypothetical protein